MKNENLKKPFKGLRPKRKRKIHKNISSKIITDFLISNLVCLIVLLLVYIIATLYISLVPEIAASILDFLKKWLNESVALFIRDYPIILVFAAYTVFFFFSCFSFSVRTLNIFNKTYKSLRAFTDERKNIEVFPKSFSEIELKLKDVQLEMVESRHLTAQLESKKNDLVMYLAHDLKTPLTSIIGYLTLLEESPELTQSQREKFTGIALEKAYRLEQLISEFFEIARFSINNVQLKQNRIDLSLLFEQIADEFYPMLNEKKLTVNLDFPEKILMYADSDKIARVIDNLLKNAVNYSYEGSSILMGARIRNGKVIIKFRNQCDEIPKETLEKLFDKFFRADNSRASKTGGSGLGLAIAKQIVELHGGTIRASSNREFTDFTVILPYISAEALTETQLEF